MAGFAFHTEDFAENYNASNLNGAISRETAAAWLAIPKNARRLFIEDYMVKIKSHYLRNSVCLHIGGFNDGTVFIKYCIRISIC